MPVQFGGATIIDVDNISGTVSLPTGASTETTLLSIDTKTPALGQATMANSSPVVIASNQSAVPASQSGTWNVNNISGTISLPTGAATETTLSSINTKTPALGQATMAASVPVVIASNQSPITVTQSFAEGNGPTFATVGIVSATTGLAAGTYAKLVFCNTSTNTISLGFDNAAVINRGIVLRGGEKIVIDGPIKFGTCNGIASGAGSNLAIQAFV